MSATKKPWAIFMLIDCICTKFSFDIIVFMLMAFESYCHEKHIIRGRLFQDGNLLH